MIDVKKVAHLARLEISSAEEETYQNQLNDIMKYFEEIAQVETTDVVPLVTPSEIALVFREDKAEVVHSVEDALKNAPERMGNLFKVPPVV